MATRNNNDYEIGEAEEEALLQSDEEAEQKEEQTTAPVIGPALITDEDSLMKDLKRHSSDDDLCRSSNSSTIDSIYDDESHLDAEDPLIKDYETALADVEKNRFDYERFVELCKLSHDIGDLDAVRKAYKLFAAAYPLTPELWLKFIKFEEFGARSPEELEQLLQLYKKALLDYYSIDVAMELTTLAQRLDNGCEVWRELLGTYGINCNKGQQFFIKYREYIAEHASLSADEKQTAYVESFLQELKYPLLNMEEHYIEFKVYYEKHKADMVQVIDWKLLDKNYFKAKEHLQKILPFENQLAELQPHMHRERHEVYSKYIKDTDKFLDENVLQTVYERMVAECCLNAECWLTYINFIDYRDEFGRPEELQQLPLFQQTALDVSERALRNCLWSDKLHINRMHLLEKAEKPRSEVQQVLEHAMEVHFPAPEPMVAVWLEYLTFLRRHTNWSDEEACEILRKNFNLCWTVLGQQWGVLADCNCEILQFWGRLEYGPLQDAKRGKELWTTVMESSDNATKSALWMEFAHLELQRDLEATRKIFRKALHATGLDYPHIIISAWTRFERCHGSLKSLTACHKECEQFLQNLSKTKITSNEAFDSAQPTTSKAAGKRKAAPAAGTMPEKRAKTWEQKNSSSTGSAAPQHDKVPNKNAAQRDNNKPKETAFKGHENEDIDLQRDHLRIFLSNLDYNLSEDDIRSGLPELKITSVDLIRSSNGRSRGFGYLELESEAEVEKALALDRKALQGRPLFISSVLRDKEKRQKFKYSDGLEPKKLFIKRLPPDVTQEELQQIYAAYGKLKDVRLVYHKSGKFKNIAYVEYLDENAASKAVMGTDEMDLRGHAISVAISAPPPKADSAPALNPAKLLGASTKRTKMYDQKPRMSFIPSAVRKTFTANVPAAAAKSEANGGDAPKTNADFRKLLEKR